LGSFRELSASAVSVGVLEALEEELEAWVVSAAELAVSEEVSAVVWVAGLVADSEVDLEEDSEVLAAVWEAALAASVEASAASGEEALEVEAWVASEAEAWVVLVEV
jgi:hypothetical protein